MRLAGADFGCASTNAWGHKAAAVGSAGTLATVMARTEAMCLARTNARNESTISKCVVYGALVGGLGRWLGEKVCSARGVVEALRGTKGSARLGMKVVRVFDSCRTVMNPGETDVVFACLGSHWGRQKHLNSATSLEPRDNGL